MRSYNSAPGIRESTETCGDTIRLFKGDEYEIFNLAEYDPLYCEGCTFEDMMLKAFKKDKNFIIAVVPIRSFGQPDEHKDIISSQQTFSRVFRFGSLRESVMRSQVLVSQSLDPLHQLKTETLGYMNQVDD